MSSPLDSTFGFWLVAIWLQTFLQGCGMLQLFATYLSAFIVQMYFAFCIYVLDRKNKIIPGIIAVLALTQIGSGLAQTIITVRLTSFTQLDSTKPVTTLEAASALLCDLMITVSLVRSLRKHKGNVKSTNSLLNNLMINAVNRGMLTAMCAALNLILFIALPGTFYFFIGLEMSGKLYMNSALATLNSRQHVVKKSITVTARTRLPSRWMGYLIIPRDQPLLMITAMFALLLPANLQPTW
ncbi:hypothetical protein BDZ97DRAFT_1191415 [Flammula alnicola]|nr:hypothetical protein BDZ97DRAFT_1191415 [Flammula alnicola]